MNAKQDDIQKCAVCDLGIMHDRSMTFYRVRFDYMLVDVAAVRRIAGLEMMLGQCAPLARVLGPDEDVAQEVSSSGDRWVCLTCATTMTLAAIHERLVTKEPLHEKPLLGNDTP